MRCLKNIVLCLFLCLYAVTSFSQNTKTQENKKKQLEREIALLQKQIEDANKKSNNALNSLTLTRKQISNRKALLEESKKELRIIDDSITLTRRSINKTQARLDTLSLYYQKLIRSAYSSRDTRIWYGYILASENLSQASRRYQYLKSLSYQMNVQANKMKELRSELDNKLAQLNNLRQEASKIKANREKELSNLQADEKRNNNIIAELKRNKTSYQKQLNNKRSQVEKLNREIEKIIADYVAQSKKSGKSKTSPADIKLASEFEANKGKLPWPAEGPVVERFGKNRHPVYTSIEMPFSNGIGIALNKGSSVKAVFNGEVKRVIVMPGYNKCVLVQHGSYFSFYCKLAEVSVKVGEKVYTGQTIGKVDTIDSQTQLHFQIWKEKTPQNPELWLR